MNPGRTSRTWERLTVGDRIPLWAEDRSTAMNIGMAGLLDPAPLLDGAGRLRLAEIRAAVDARLNRAPDLRRRICLARPAAVVRRRPAARGLPLAAPGRGRPAGCRRGVVRRAPRPSCHRPGRGPPGRRPGGCRPRGGPSRSRRSVTTT